MLFLFFMDHKRSGIVVDKSRAFLDYEDLIQLVRYDNGEKCSYERVFLIEKQECKCLNGDESSSFYFSGKLYRIEKTKKGSYAPRFMGKRMNVPVKHLSGLEFLF